MDPDRARKERDAIGRPAGPGDVDVSDADSVRRWSRALGTTDEALIGAVHAVGKKIERIKEYLGAGGMAADQEDA